MGMMDIANTLFGASTTSKGRDFLLGSPAKTKQLPTLNKDQLRLLGQMIQLLGPGGGLGQGFGESLDYQRQLMDPSSEAVNQFTQPYVDQFNQQTIPGLAERFAGLGGGLGGGLSSSGFGQSLSSAAGNLQTQLAALKAGLGQQAAGQLMSQYTNLSGQALGKSPFGYMQQPGTQGFLPQALSAYLQAGFPGLGNMGSSFANAGSAPRLNNQISVPSYGGGTTFIG
jgi:hypothetical protein